MGRRSIKRIAGAIESGNWNRESIRFTVNPVATGVMWRLRFPKVASSSGKVMRIKTSVRKGRYCE